MTEKTKPVKVYQRQGVTLALWPSKSGYSIKLYKRYKASDGTYKTSEYFFDSDLPLIAAFAQSAFDWASVTRDAELTGNSNPETQGETQDLPF